MGGSRTICSGRPGSASVPPANPGRPLSRQELAEAVNSWVYDHTGQVCCLDEQHIRRYEAGHHRNPCPRYRQALRAVLHAGSDETLGFR